MRILSTEYERHIDDLAVQKMEALTCAEIVEALSCSVEIDELENDLTMAVRRCVPTLAAHSICYQYWRGVIAGQNPFNEWVETQKEDEAADSAEDTHELYEMNQRGD